MKFQCCFMLICAFAFGLSLLSSCGVNGVPNHPEGSVYPRPYPAE